MRYLLVLASMALAVAATSPRAATGQAPATATPLLPTISIDLASLDRPTFEALKAAGVYQGLVLRLVNEKVALVSPREAADFALRFLPGAREGELRIVASSPQATRERSIVIGPPARLEEEAVQLAVIHAAVELVRQVQSATPPRAPPTEPVMRLHGELAAGMLRTGATAGVLVRVAGARRVGPGELGLALAVHRPLALPSSLAVTEGGAFAVAGSGERALGPSVRVAAGLDVGAWVHRWSFDGAGRSDSGARLDLAAHLHGETTWRLSRSWRAGAEVGLLWVSRSHVHRDAAGTVWQAPSVRPFAGLTVAFGREGESR